MKTHPVESSFGIITCTHRFGFGAALCLAALSSIFGPAESRAARFYWDTNGSTLGAGGTGTWNLSDTTWSSVFNGTGTVVAWNSSGTDEARFEGEAGTITVAEAVTATQLYFTTGGFTLSGAAAVTLASTSNISIIEVGSAATTGITINNAINVDGSLRNVVGDADFNIRNVSATNLTLNGPIAFSGPGEAATSGNKHLNIEQNNATGSIVLNGAISATNLGSSSFRLRFRGADGANFYLNGDSSTLSGTTTLGRGILHVGHNNALGTGSFVLGDSGYTTNGNTLKLFANAGVTVTNTVFVSLGSAVTTSTGATAVIGGDSAGQVTFASTINIDKYVVNLEAAQNGRVDFSGAVSGGAGGGAFSAGSIQKTGAGIVRLTRAGGNTYTGGTTVSEGVLVLGNTSGSGTGTGAVAVNAGATLAGTGIATGMVTSADASSVFSAGDMAINGTSAVGTLSLTGGLTASNGATFKVDINGATSDQFNFGAGAVTLGNAVHFDVTTVGSGITPGIAYSFFGGSGSWSGAPTFTFSAPVGYSLDVNYGGGNGYVWNAEGNSLLVQFAATAIPEPGSYALMLGGVALLSVMMMRPRAKRS